MPPAARILIVEQEPEPLSTIWVTLIQMGAEPRAVESGKEAVRLIDQESFDGFFVDLEMADVNGLEIAEKVRWSKLNSRSPIVLITDSQEPGVLKECFQGGANLFLEKPVTPEQVHVLFNAIRGIVSGERRRYQRVPVHMPVYCHWTVGFLPQQVRGESITLSASGMLVRLGLTPPSQSVVQLQFMLPGVPDRFDLTSRVASIREGQEIGFSFVGLDEADRRRLITFTDAVSRRNREANSAP